MCKQLALWISGLLLLSLLTREVQAQPASPETAASELTLADQWLAVSTRQKKVAQGGMQWLAPAVLVVGAGALSGLAISGEDGRKSSRWGTGLTAAGGMAMAIPTALSSHERRPYWLLGGIGLLLVGEGATFLANSRQPRDCLDDCMGPRGERFFGAGVLTHGIATLGFMLFPRPPSLAELEAAQRLPAEQRVRASERLLLRMDRAQRLGNAWLVATYLASGAVFAVGAARSKPGEDRDALSVLASVWLGHALLHAVIGLATPSRLERFIEGRGPRRGWGGANW